MPRGLAGGINPSELLDPLLPGCSQVTSGIKVCKLVLVLSTNIALQNCTPPYSLRGMGLLSEEHYFD